MTTVWWVEFDDYTKFGLPVVAATKEDALKYAADELGVQTDDLDPNETRQLPDQEGDLPEGVVDAVEGLRREMYSWVDDAKCPSCGNEFNRLYYDKATDTVWCVKCPNDVLVRVEYDDLDEAEEDKQ